MNVAWAMFGEGSRSTKPCVFPCKVAGILLYASRLLRAAACVILLSFELNSVIRIGMAASRLR